MSSVAPSATLTWRRGFEVEHHGAQPTDKQTPPHIKKLIVEYERLRQVIADRQLHANGQ